MPLQDATGRFDLAAVHGINRFLWARLKQTFGMTEESYGKLVPIIPSQQIPQFTTRSEPFIVYNWVTETQGVDWYFERDQIMYVIYSEEEKELRQIVNFMRSEFEKFDESARELNDFIRKNGSLNQKRFQYKYLNVMPGSGGALPPATEGGRMETMLALTASYTVDRSDTFSV